MDKQFYYKQKIKAFLHDPPEKPLILGFKDHEITSEEYIKALLGEDEAFDKDQWAFADHVASAADRTSFPLKESRKFWVNFRKNPVLTHPNSGHLFDLEEYQLLEPQELKKNVLKAMEKIRGYSDGDHEKAFLYLWRLLPEFTSSVEEGNASLGLLWDYLPADTRIPDHSVLDHARMVSAFAGAGIHKDDIEASLLIFSIGPVQEFIAAARKTSDLWAGSYMLSWLSWNAMKVFCEAFGPDCILFPDLYGQPMVDYWLKHEKGLKELSFDHQNLMAPTLPNRFFAVIPKNQADEIASKAEEQVHSALTDIGKFSFEKLESSLPDNAPDVDGWIEQFENFTQCYWTCLDLPNWKKGEKNLNDKFKDRYQILFEFIDNGHDNSKQYFRDMIFNAYQEGGFHPNLGTFYGRFYEITEKALGSRKSLRNFNQVTQKGYRCSLIPGLDALTPVKEDIPQPKEYRKFWDKFYENMQSNGSKSKLGKNERLSPLALSKRYFPEYLKQKAFPKAKHFHPRAFTSTHTFAVADFKYQLVRKLCNTEKAELYDLLIKFIESAKNFREKYLTLEPESPLPKLHYEARDADMDCQMDVINLCSMPGELLQMNYYEGSFKDDLIEPELFEKDRNGFKRNVREHAGEVKGNLKKLITNSGLKNPSKYYAILYLDGDNMGKWLSGDKAPQFWKVLHPDAVKVLVDGIEDEDQKNHELYKGWAEIFSLDKNGMVERNGKENGRVKYDSRRRPQAPTQHMAISRALNNFSLHLVRTIVEEKFLGRLIYAGGDDVVAMVSIGNALECAETLRAAFSGHLKSDKTKAISELENTLEDKDSSNGYIAYQNKNNSRAKSSSHAIATTLGPNASASCGIAIAHYMYPLKQAMAEARKAEKFAKDDLGRDAFAINVVKRSGETTLAGGKWRLGNTNMLVNSILQQFAHAIYENRLSPKFIVDIEEVLDSFVALPPDAIHKEVKRLFKQHAEGFKNSVKQKEAESDKDFAKRTTQKKNDFFDNVINPLLTHCNQLTGENKMKKQLTENGKPADWKALRNVIKLLDIAYYIGKGGGR